MWNILKITKEDLGEEIVSKVDRLTNSLELLCMRNGETIG